MSKRKRVAILGSTGSIGTQALDVIARHPDRFEVVALAAGRNVELLAGQVQQFRPQVVSAGDPAAASELAARTGSAARIVHGAGGLRAVAVDARPDLLLAATDGAVAFDAVFAAVDAGIDVAVANKELIVAAGELLFAHARRGGAKLLPVDSEHSAIFQCLDGEPPERIAGIVLTASGGPFWTRSAAEMRDASVADAMRHPTWTMGMKNTIDSATLMNKGLEVIEASRFFDLPGERIHVLVHRTSIAHGFAIFTDGNVIGQFAAPDMRLPIGYALAYPDRLPDRFGGAQPVDALAALGGAADAAGTTLGFERPDPERFPCLALAYRALATGGTAPAALSAANEIAVAAFADGRLRFGDIANCIASVLDELPHAELTLDAVRAADRRARELAGTFVERHRLHDRQPVS
jgi:1-deoxy-D-xylulose-5-phosphate reductoisomerase